MIRTERTTRTLPNPANHLNADTDHGRFDGGLPTGQGLNHGATDLMRIGEIIGTVTLNRWHPSLVGGRFKLVVPLSLADLAGQGGAPAEELTLYDELGAGIGLTLFDELGAGIGSRVAFSEGREAAQPFHPRPKPIDAYCAAILDTVNIVNPEAENPER